MQFFMAAVSSPLITWVTQRLEVVPRLVCSCSRNFDTTELVILATWGRRQELSHYISISAFAFGKPTEYSVS